MADVELGKPSKVGYALVAPKPRPVTTQACFLCCCPCRNRRWSLTFRAAWCCLVLVALLGIATLFTALLISDIAAATLTAPDSEFRAGEASGNPSNFTFTLLGRPQSCAWWPAADEAKEYEKYWLPKERWSEVRFRTADGNARLHGFHIFHNDSVPTVIVIHGFKECANHWTTLIPAKFLHDAGFNVFAYSHRSHGLSSDNSPHRLHWGLVESDDVVRAVEVVRTGNQEGNITGMAFNSSQPVGLLGTSMGGFITLQGFAKRSMERLGVRSCVVNAPVTQFERMVSDQIDRFSLPPVIFKPMLLKFLDTYVRGITQLNIDGIWTRADRAQLRMGAVHNTNDGINSVGHSYWLRDEAARQRIGPSGDGLVKTWFETLPREDGCTDHVNHVMRREAELRLWFCEFFRDSLSHSSALC